MRLRILGWPCRANRWNLALYLCYPGNVSEEEEFTSAEVTGG